MTADASDSHGATQAAAIDVSPSDVLHSARHSATDIRRRIAEVFDGRAFERPLFHAVSSRPHCSVRLFDLARGLMAFPYDDRGMDVVGTGHEHLASLYRRHEGWLLEHDRPRMQAMFDASR